MFAIPEFTFTDPPKDPEKMAQWSNDMQLEMMKMNSVMSVINAMYDNAKTWINQISN